MVEIECTCGISSGDRIGKSLCVLQASTVMYPVIAHISRGRAIYTTDRDGNNFSGERVQEMKW